MIVVWGDTEDAPVERVLQALDERAAPRLHIDSAALGRLRYDLHYGPAPRGWIELDGQRLPLERLRAWYLRPTELGGTAPAAARSAAAVLMALAAMGHGCVVNRPAAGMPNAAKPYQLGLIEAAGIDVPPTLVTSDPDAARAFVRRHGRVIYKSISGVRSIVASLQVDDPRLDTLGHGPVQLQRWVPGTDVRVHVVGRRCFATAIESDADDYRYAARSGQAARLSATRIPPALGRRLVALAQQLGLRVAGIDLRHTPDGRWVCFEVNPSPGFSFYEDATGQPIADAIAGLLLSARMPAPRKVAPGHAGLAAHAGDRCERPIRALHEVPKERHRLAAPVCGSPQPTA